MPDIITHYLFGLDTTNNIKSSPLYKTIKNNRGLFFVGLQGPDPMYYHAPYKKNNYTSVASLMHTEKTGDFLVAALSYAKMQLDKPEVFEPCISYISGLICHYVLDFMCHPYVFYIGGRYMQDDESTRPYQGLHKRIEVAIDALLLEEKFGLKADAFKIHKHILKEHHISPAVLDMYEEVLYAVYAVPDGGQIFKQSYADFRYYYQLTYDRTGFKKAFAHSISPVFPKSISPFMTSFSYHNCVDEFSDYLNTNKEVWLHPVTGTVYTFSFKDLLHNSLKISSSLLNTAYAFIQSEITYDELVEQMPKLSYLSGLPISDDRPMIYFSQKLLDYTKREI